MREKKTIVKRGLKYKKKRNKMTQNEIWERVTQKKENKRT